MKLTCIFIVLCFSICCSYRHRKNSYLRYIQMFHEHQYWFESELCSAKRPIEVSLAIEEECNFISLGKYVIEQRLRIYCEDLKEVTPIERYQQHCRRTNKISPDYQKVSDLGNS